MNFNDAMQANLGFVIAQTAHVESEVYKIKYPDIQYQNLIPVDTSANPWATTVTYMSQDQTGKANWIGAHGQDIPMVGLSREQFNTPVSLAGIGYDYSIEEVQQAAMLGIPLTADKASASRRAYEEMVDRIAMFGDTQKGFSGLINTATVPKTVVAPVDGELAWADKDPDGILKDINDGLTKVHVDTNTVALADTVLLPWTQMHDISTRRIRDTTVLQFLLKNNIYTAVTGQPLTIRGVRGLETAGDEVETDGGASARMVCYRRSPEVLKLHIPMALRFLPVQIQMLRYVVPGIFRLGGLDVRLPKEVLYVDGI